MTIQSFHDGTIRTGAAMPTPVHALHEQSGHNVTIA